MEKEMNLKADEVLNYIKSNVKNYDVLEISYNRVFVPGEVLDINAVEINDDFKSFRLLIKMNGETIRDTVEVDLVEIMDDVVEIRHITDEKSTVLCIEED
ncbi:MAG: DUF2097 domain-containing protein [Methanobacterium sp.]